ncbi:hypothetical protein RCCGEPOP_27694 [Rhizobium sp. Pop5]|nr:hypothetical protein RCCGEPOP_27694 [Rhizobium sp. Pop5]
MIDEKLRAPAEEILQRGIAAFGVEAILLVDPDTGQLLAFGRQRIALPRQFLLLLEQIEPRRQPLLACCIQLCRHGASPLPVNRRSIRRGCRRPREDYGRMGGWGE